MKVSINFLVVLFLSGCIDSYDPHIDSGPKQIVIEGQITNAPGPYTVKISRTVPYLSASDLADPVENAIVSIEDNMGNSEILVAKGAGSYETSPDGIKGVAGRSYTLTIITEDGNQYQSYPERLSAAPPIKAIYTRFKTGSSFNENNVELPLYYFEILVDIEDVPGEENFYLWQWDGIYEIFTHPELFTVKIDGVPTPAPKDCCARCWVVTESSAISILKDTYLDGNSIKGQVAATVPVNKETFQLKYFVNLDQLALSEGAFNFYKEIVAQQVNVGSMFDTPPYTVTGNVYNLQNPDEKVFGYFSAAGITEESIYISRGEVPVLLAPFEFNDDCRRRSGASTIKPPNWD